MKGRAWSTEDDALLRARFPSTPTADLARALARSYSATAARAGMLGLRKTAEGLARAATGRRTGGKRRTWTEAADAQLRALYPDVSTEDVARRLGRSVSATYGRAQKLGLAKSAEYLASPAACRLRRGDHVGAAYRYQKGHEPANKGLRRPGWSAGRMKESQYTKGQVGTRWQPVGSERLAGGYRYTKVSEHRFVPWTRNWRPTHVLLWEREHGPIPPHHALVFANGDRADIRLENLQLLTRRELMARNSLHNLPAPLPQVIQLLGAINRKINRRARHEEQDRGPAQSPVRDARKALGPGESHAARPGEDDRGRGARGRRVGEGGGSVHPGDGRPRRDGVHHAPRGCDAASAARGRLDALAQSCSVTQQGGGA